MEIVTGYAGKKHVTANKQGCMHMGLAGNGDYILQDGEKLRAEIITNNKIRIYDGDLVMQGRQAHIAPGSYEDVTISNGGQDVKRNDIIAAQYVMNSDTGVESITLVVIEGTAGSTAADPVLTTGDIRGGDTLHEMPLYRVKLNGLTVEAVEQIAPVLPSLDSLNMDLASCFQSVSNGKSLIAAAITDKGVTTAADATFEVMANNVLSISTVPDLVRVNKTFTFVAKIGKFDYTLGVSGFSHFAFVEVARSNKDNTYVGISILSCNTKEIKFRVHSMDGNGGDYPISFTIVGY
jgi:hypothetical protein